MLFSGESLVLEVEGGSRLEAVAFIMYWRLAPLPRWKPMAVFYPMAVLTGGAMGAFSASYGSMIAMS